MTTSTAGSAAPARPGGRSLGCLVYLILFALLVFLGRWLNDSGGESQRCINHHTMRVAVSSRCQNQAPDGGVYVWYFGGGGGSVPGDTVEGGSITPPVNSGGGGGSGEEDPPVVLPGGE